MKLSADIPGKDDPGPGRRLGIDVGTVRIGVAVSDRNGILATPVETISRTTGLRDRDSEDIDRIMQLIADYDAVEVVVGLPSDLHGNGSRSAKHAKDFAFRINRRLASSQTHHPVVVRMADERLTTVIATQALHASGVAAKAGRRIIDQAAAVEILQSWLDGRRHAVGDVNLGERETGE